MSDFYDCNSIYFTIRMYNSTCIELDYAVQAYRGVSIFTIFRQFSILLDCNSMYIFNIFNWLNTIGCWHVLIILFANSISPWRTSVTAKLYFKIDCAASLVFIFQSEINQWMTLISRVHALAVNQSMFYLVNHDEWSRPLWVLQWISALRMFLLLLFCPALLTLPLNTCVPTFYNRLD